MNKKHLPLAIGIALPIVFIIIISIALWIPKLFLNPQHDFIYFSNEKYSYSTVLPYGKTYVVDGGHISMISVPPDTTRQYSPNAPTLYLYNMKQNTTKEISYADAKALPLDPGPSSPDGYTFEYEYNYGDIFDLFGGRTNRNGYFIKKNGAGKRLAIPLNDRYNDNNLTLIGWVK